MKKEIGGYFELEELSGKEYYPELYKVNLGRTALLWLLEARQYTRIYLPVFLCESVTDACRKAGIQVEEYRLDEELNVLLPKEKLSEQECLYLVNYYGQLTDEQILNYQNVYGNVIVDHTHAFFQKPLRGVDTLYSCRKFWGVSDGAYLATDAVLSEDKPFDHSNGRMEHILGRYETDAGTYYSQMLQNASTYSDMEIRRMSRLTQNLLQGIDYEKGKNQRESNYKLLKSILLSEHVFNRILPEGPFTYPYYCENGLELRKWLSGHKVFVPTYWKNILENFPEDSKEYRWAANILPLPCDQRYGKEEMEYMASLVREWEAAQ